jgi:hypothetical protein
LAAQVRLASHGRLMNATPLIVLCDPTGSVSEDGDRGPLWSTDCRPTGSLKGLCAELLMAGWPLSTMLKLPGVDEPERFSDIYKREVGHLPKHVRGIDKGWATSHRRCDSAFQVFDLDQAMRITLDKPRGFPRVCARAIPRTRSSENASRTGTRCTSAQWGHLILRVLF